MRKIQFMNRLWVRLTLAFAIVAVFGIGLAALLADLAIDREFRSYVGRNEANLQNGDLATKLVDYYTQHQGWSGVGTVLTPGRPPAGFDDFFTISQHPSNVNFYFGKTLFRAYRLFSLDLSGQAQ